ncbi:MAG: neutral zinc metallopeptidase [Thermomicrobiales bacterium]
MPLRRMFALFALALTMLAPVSAAAQSTEAAYAADLDVYWAGQFANQGLSYSSPGFMAIYGETSTGCGPVSPEMLGPAAYCPIDNVIYVAPIWEQVYGGDEWITILAHEWGHHVQVLVGLGGYPTDESELQADCLAGAYVADAEARGAIPQGTFNRGMGTSIRSGQPPFLPDEADVHGTGAERGGSYIGGYMSGTSACGIW